jgi:mannose-binding lectin 2
MRLSSLSAAFFAAFAWTAKAAEEGEIKSVSLRTHTLVQPYLDSDMQSRWFDFGGDTIVRTDSYDYPFFDIYCKRVEPALIVPR